MAFIKISLIAAFLAVVGALGALHYAQVEREQESARLKKANAQMRLAISERQPAEPLTIDSVFPRSEGQPGGALAGASSPDLSDRRSPADKTRQFPVRSYFNAGQATPMAALQTMAWACDQGDVATARKLIIIDDSAQEKAAAVYAALPAEVLAQWDSLEAFTAAVIVSDGIKQPFPGSEILALSRIERIREGRVRQLLPATHASGLVFQLTKEGWKYVITEALVDDFIKQHKITLPSSH